ncbi:MAG: DegQ family serine endoprotease [Rhodocyclaceae bacterium]|nr:DegQ family serine endoprotease [Pseudomonadota bacterium]MDQ7973213.1 DegQ family serine endoprotease [Rhodocyclaceae bacterium]MDQ7998561.1 DegQ family serine endoprotease [Pseudomonadota bacterium]MDQ8018774.1 DegQ family serine endoprotease [Pseudomonadota bacterium]
MKTINTPQRLVLALAAAGVLGAAGAGAYTSARASGQPAPVTTPMVAPIAAPDFSTITARNGPAVVNISVTGVTKTASADGAAGIAGMDPNDPFYEFFQQFRGPNMPKAPQREVPTRGQGSGFIISPDGTILTNAHVVKDAKEVTVKLTDRREFRAKVLGSDPKTDIAVLKIDAKNLPTVPIGNVKDLKVGEWVLAIGSPFGFENTVTAGVVSAKGRSLPDDSYTPFIQTDVPINPGNSGGPLFNARGEVVGINSQIYSRSGGYQGVSFAIPIDIATKVKDQIVATGKASHAKLGVAVQEVNQTFADSFKLDKPEGALVSNVEKGSAAEKAGLQSGDVILKVDGQPIVSSGDLPAIIGQMAPGQKVALEVWRKGAPETLSAKLADASDKVQTAKADDAAGQGKLGLALRPLQPQEKRESSLDNGLVVEDARGPSALAGVQAGDVLLAINGTPAKSVEQVRQAVAKADKSVALLIQRGDDRIFVPVRIG